MGTNVVNLHCNTNELAESHSNEVWNCNNLDLEIEKTKTTIEEIVGFSSEEMVNQILELEITDLPNKRDSYIYKYLSKIIKPLLSKWVIWISKGRATKYKIKTGIFRKQRWVDIDGLEKNKAHVQSYLEDNWELNGKYYRKVNLYYWIYETVVVERIQNDLLNINWEIDKHKFHNIVRNVVNQFLYMIYAFWDKLNIEQFSWLFLKTKKINGNQPADIEGIISSCKQVVTIINKLTPDDNNDADIELTQEDKDIYHDLLDVYKSFIPTWVIVDWESTIFDASLISVKISKHFEDVMVNIADIFKHWYYSHRENKDELYKILWLLEHFMLSVNFLKEKDIAFSEIDTFYIREVITDPSNNVGKKIIDLLKTDSEIEAFKRLLYITDWVDLDDKNTMQDSNNKTLDEKLKKLSIDVGIDKANSVHKLVFWEEEQLTVFDFHIYNNLWPDNRKKYFLRNVYQLDENNNINWININTLDENKVRTDNFYKYCFLAYWNNIHTEEKIESDLKRAFFLVNNWVNIHTFEEKHITSEQILVSWFRYNMILDSYPEIEKSISNNEWKELNLINQEIIKIDKSLLWAREKILSNTSEEVLDGMNMDFIAGHMKNSSISWDSHLSEIDKLIEDHNLKFRKRPVNLNDWENFWYLNKKWKQVLFKDHSELFLNYNIPNNLDDNNIDDQLKIYNLRRNHIVEFIELTNILLQRKNISEIKNIPFKDINWEDIFISEESYNNLIIIINNLWIDHNDYNSIGKLKKFLKYTLYCLTYADKLHKKSINDYNKIHEITNIFNEGLINQNSSEEQWLFQVGKPKNFNRIFQKLIWSYAWDIREMRDLVRCRYIATDLNDSYTQFTEVLNLIHSDPTLQVEIIQWLIDDNCWNHSEKAEKATGYRDLSIELKTKDWIVMEFQFITKEIFEWKHYWLTEDKLLKIYQDKDISVDNEFIEELENRCIAENIPLPNFMKALNPNISNNEIEQTNNTFNSDDLYRLWRWSANKAFKSKIQYMESIVYDIMWWKVISQQTKTLLEEIRKAA